MKTRWWILVPVLSVAINAAVLGICGYHYYLYTCLSPSVYSFPSSKTHHFYQALGLSALQLKRIEPLAHTFHIRLEKLHSGMQAKRDLLVDLLRQKRVDSEKVENLRKDMASIQDEFQREVIIHIKEIKKILNPEQEERFFNLLRISMEREGSHWLSENRGK